MGLYGDQECEDVEQLRHPWEEVKGPSGESALSSGYAVFYRNGSFEDIEATDNFGDRISLSSIYPKCHWIYNIPEGKC